MRWWWQVINGDGPEDELLGSMLVAAALISAGSSLWMARKMSKSYTARPTLFVNQLWHVAVADFLAFSTICVHLIVALVDYDSSAMRIISHSVCLSFRGLATTGILVSCFVQVHIALTTALITYTGMSFFNFLARSLPYIWLGGAAVGVVDACLLSKSSIDWGDLDGCSSLPASHLMRYPLMGCCVVICATSYLFAYVRFGNSLLNSKRRTLRRVTLFFFVFVVTFAPTMVLDFAQLRKTWDETRTSFAEAAIETLFNLNGFGNTMLYVLFDRQTVRMVKRESILRIQQRAAQSDTPTSHTPITGSGQGASMFVGVRLGAREEHKVETQTAEGLEDGFFDVFEEDGNGDGVIARLMSLLRCPQRRADT